MDDSESRGLERAKAATGRLINSIGNEFGLLSRAEVTAGGMDPEAMLWVKRGGQHLYPRFQISEAGVVLPVVHQLVELAEDVGWSRQSVTFWLCSPSGSFRGTQPIDHLDDKELVAIAEDVWTTDW